MITRRRLFAAALGLLAGAAGAVPRATRWEPIRSEAVPAQEDVGWEDVDPTAFVFETDQHGITAAAVTERLDQGTVDWEQVNAEDRRLEIDRLRRREMLDAVSERIRIWVALRAHGRAEIVESSHVVNTAAEEGPRATVLVAPDQFEALSRAVQGQAGGGFYLASRGDAHWILAAPTLTPDQRLSINALGVGLIPCGIKTLLSTHDLRAWVDDDGWIGEATRVDGPA